MPLIRLTADEAIENRKTNPYSTWGDRAGANRVEPVAKPAFAVPFKFDRGSKIFTVGSCFARNVEEELERRGFELPMRKVILQDTPTATLNNYGTPSIYNEFAWAFGDRPYVTEDHIMEVMAGKYADIHLSPTLRPEPRERVLARRQAITASYRQAAECPVLIMTLGLVETWFDTKTGYYLNVSPRPSHMKAEPKRFELHVLSFEECYDYLERAVLLVKKHSKHDLRVLLTVSPVPLTSTHRKDDVIVANAYSKSVLRAAAETLIAKHSFVTYYPSYESVTLSDRQRAFREDLVHVTHEMVALNVGRMVDAYIGEGDDLASIGAQIEAGGPAVAVEKAKTVRTGSRELAAQFFATHAALSGRSPEFALEHAQFLSDTGNNEGVVKVLDGAPPDTPVLQAAIMRAQALVKLGRAGEAVAALEAHSSKTDGPSGKKMRAANFWYALLDAAQATGDDALVTGTLARFIAANPAHAPRANNQVGRWFKDRGQIERAIGFFEMAAAAGQAGDIAQLSLAECLAALGRRDEAREALSKLKAKGVGAEFRAERLMEVLE